MNRILIFLLLITSGGLLNAQYSWVTFPNTNDVESGITTFAFEDENNLWAGTVMKGIYHFKNGQYVNFSEANSDIPGNIVNKILLDENSNKWIATSKGLSIMTGDYFENYTTENSNLLSNQINDIALDRGLSPSGQVWYGARDGSYWYV